ncbi:hypothetical protein QPK24_23205 [Paenibacillus polygoni]|uniref:HEAT repeat protein n=1 Tax=Paenibacillus polygoni TaxID=3050112 RepID=A0ABY8X111_9BACL|nr:hypothetical protein [Paenibacillus polygoni]WIV19185.1 hypothetical protein QPK24_23205 [Paenibacillus polygoni]
MDLIYFSIIFFFVVLFLVILYLVFSKVKQAMDHRRVSQLENEMQPIVDKYMQLESGSIISEDEMDNLRKKVQAKAGLQAFNSIYFARVKQDGLTEKLHQLVTHVIDFEMLNNNRIVRNKYRKSYILYLCAEYYMNSEEVTNFALESLDDPSLYVRNNALRVLRNTGNVDTMMEAYRRISKGKSYFNNKVIVDFMDSFCGDVQELNKALASHIAEFCPKIKRGILDHFTNRRISEYADEMLQFITTSSDKEIIIAGIRYFGVVHKQEAYPFIVENFKSKDYEMRAVCARAIGLYPCEETITLLHEYIKDANWFVRYNCAFTLFRLEEEDIFNKDSSIRKVLCEKDNFARDIMIYTLYSKGLINSDHDQVKLARFQIENVEKEERRDGFKTNHLVH